MLKDYYNRTFHYLRLSITDVCNFSCKYCVSENFSFKQKNYLSLKEIYNLISFLSDLGIQKVRITGGEPTTRKDFFTIAKIVSSFSNIKSLVLTTNGYKLEDMSEEIIKSGFNSINVSIDTLNEKKFKILTGRDYFKKVYNGLLKSISLGLNVKVNVVLSNFFSFDDFEDFYFLAKYKNVTIRFIDQMQTNYNTKINNGLIKSSVIHKYLINNYWEKEKKDFLNGPAFIFKSKSHLGKIGLISPYSEKFCDGCNRLRISSNGELYLCLFGNSKYYIRNYLDSHLKKNDFQNFLIDSLKFKTKSHSLLEKKSGILNYFSNIGG